MDVSDPSDPTVDTCVRRNQCIFIAKNTEQSKTLKDYYNVPGKRQPAPMILKWHTHEMPVPEGSLDALKHIIDNLPDYITQNTAIEDVPEKTETCFVSLSNDRTAVTIKAISKDQLHFCYVYLLQELCLEVEAPGKREAGKKSCIFGSQ